MNRRTRRSVGVGIAAGLACAACCAIEWGLLGGLSALSIGAGFTGFDFLAPVLAVAVLATAAVMLVRRRRGRQSRTRTRTWAISRESLRSPRGAPRRR